jgi:4a-hydroxytetrahydrobiopterin dehydratase
MSELAGKSCEPCRGGIARMDAAAIDGRLKQLDGWSVDRLGHLSKTFRFADFVSALAFVNRVGGIAEEQQHHPDLHLAWGKVGVELWTHKVDGLTESDFVLAAKIDRAV